MPRDQSHARVHPPNHRCRGEAAERNALITDIHDNHEMTQAEVCRLVDLTREQVRRIVRAEHQRRAHDPAPE